MTSLDGGSKPPPSLNPWELAQERLKKILDELSFENWFAQTHFVSYADGRLVVGVPNRFFADWLRDHYLDTVTACASAALGDLREVEFVPTGEGVVTSATARGEGAGIGRAKDEVATFRIPRFNPRFVFERFVVGAGNRFAHAAAKAVAEQPARAYNPLFMYGGTGLGKTHLMQAIGQEILRRRPDAKVVYVSSEYFMNQLIESIAKKTTVQFRAKYRKADILLVDDIHVLAKKEATQEEFFHTFNALFDSHKQIVMSSDRPPKEITELEHRLISRFEWGLVTDIQPPDLETRIAILQNKAAEENLIVPPDVLTRIATVFTLNIRELEGALVTLLAYAKLTEKRITRDMAEEVLRDLMGRGRLQPPSIEAILRVVAEHFDVRITDLRGRSRHRQISYPRQVAMYLCKSLIQGISFKDIAREFGGKDHSTVIYSVQKIEKEIKSSAQANQLIALLTRKLQGQ